MEPTESPYATSY